MRVNTGVSRPTDLLKLSIPNRGNLLQVDMSPAIPIRTRLESVRAAIESIHGFYNHHDSLGYALNGQVIPVFDAKMLRNFLSDKVDFFVEKAGGKNKPTKREYGLLDLDVAEIFLQTLKLTSLKPLSYISKFFMLFEKAKNEFEFSKKEYDERCRAYSCPKDIPIQKELHHIKRVLKDFSFKDDSCFSTCLAFMLTKYIHHIIPGAVPILFIEANQKGLGKTLLAQIIARIRSWSQPVIATLTDDDRENANTVVSCFNSCVYVIIYDNIKNSKNLPEIGGAFLEAMITNSVIQIRKFHQQNLISIPNNFQIIFTTNGGRSSDDITSRIIGIDLYYEGNPNLRKFENDDPIAYVFENQDEIEGELLGLMNNWFEKGCPLRRKKTTRFPKWEAIVGGILEANGITGFLEDQRGFASESQSITLFRSLIPHIPLGRRMTAKEILDRCRAANAFKSEISSSALFGRKILAPILGEKIEIGDKKFSMVSSGKNSANSALYELRLEIGEEPELNEILSPVANLLNLKEVKPVPGDSELKVIF